MEKLKVVLDWFPNTNHTGYLLAEKLGWFNDAGLDVEIVGEVHGAMSLHGADFICGPEISMLDCMERGEKMTCVAVMTQKCDSGIVSLKSAGITRPRELEGKRLTHWSPAWFHKAIGRVVEDVYKRQEHACGGQQNGQHQQEQRPDPHPGEQHGQDAGSENQKIQHRIMRKCQHKGNGQQADELNSRIQ